MSQVPAELAPTPDLAERLLVEIDAVRGALSPMVFATVGLVILAGFLFAQAWVGFANVAWRLGFDPDHKLAVWVGGAKVGSLIAVVTIVARMLLATAPLLTIAGVTLAVPCVLLVLAPSIQSMVVGLELTLLRRVREGDRVIFGGRSGIVRRVGLTHVDLGSADGNTHHVPNRLLAQEALEVERAKNTVPVTARVFLDSAPTPEVVEAARRVGVLSPYRVPGSAVVTQPWTRATSQLAVEIHVWSERAAADAARQLEAQLRAIAEQIQVPGRRPTRGAKRRLGGRRFRPSRGRA